MRIAIALLLGCAPAAAPEPWVAEVALGVSDAESSAAWFESTLGARRSSATTIADEAGVFGVPDAEGTAVAIAIGNERVVLRSFAATSRVGAPTGDDLRFQHLAIVVDDMDAAYAHLLAAGVDVISTQPQEIPRRNAAAAGIRAFYFRGPDGHPLELIAYPADKGRAAWHEQRDDLVLGVDHTAIAVSDTEASLAFYRDALGLTVVGASLNEGIEQERLSGVDGARVRITSLRGPVGMGVELLEYVAPTRIRERPRPRASDTAYAETTIVVDDLDAVRNRLATAENLSIAAGTCEACSVGERDFIVLDPDAHAIRLVE